MNPMVHDWPRRYPPGPEPRQPVTAPPSPFQKMRARRERREASGKAMSEKQKLRLEQDMRWNARADAVGHPLPCPDVAKEHQPWLVEGEADARRNAVHRHWAAKREQCLSREGLGTISSAPTQAESSAWLTKWWPWGS